MYISARLHARSPMGSISPDHTYVYTGHLINISLLFASIFYSQGAIVKGLDGRFKE